MPPSRWPRGPHPSKAGGLSRPRIGKASPADLCVGGCSVFQVSGQRRLLRYVIQRHSSPHPLRLYHVAIVSTLGCLYHYLISPLIYTLGYDLSPPLDPEPRNSSRQPVPSISTTPTILKVPGVQSNLRPVDSFNE